MKTDNFDEAFRRKVEGFHPPFRDDEIDRIQGYIHQHIPLSFWQRFGHTFTYSAGTLAIVSLLTYTLFQANENKTLLNKISNLSTQLEHKQANIAKIAPKSTVLIKTDTVFVVKYVTKSSTIDEVRRVFNPSESTKSSTIDEVRRVFNPSESTKSSAIDEVRRVFNPSESTESIAIDEVRRVFNPSENSKEISNSKTLATAGRVENPSYNAQNTFAEISEKPIIKNDIPQIENSSKALIINELKSKTFDFSTSKNIDDLLNRKIKLPHFPTITKATKSSRFPSISMENMKYRVGFGTNAEHGQRGASLLTDILFAKRWSFTSGVNLAFLRPEHFGDEDDFKRKTNKDFRDKYPTNAPIINPIEDIDIHQVLLRVPLYLNYRLPLRKDYTLLFSSGTDFDLSLRQFTSYNHRDFYKDDKPQDIIEKMSVIPFNNVLFSVGIEKRWKHFSVQLNPYFSTQIKQVSYRNENYSFGFKLNGFYRLSR